jgi:hypothetical protein
MKHAIIGLALLLFAYPVLGQKVNVKYDKAVDFSKYKTYTWVPGSPAKNPIINQMIIDAVDQQMAARGLTKADAKGDIQLLYVAAMDLDLQIAGINWSNATYATGSIYRPPPPMDVHKGMLVVDMMDNKTERYIWRATAKKTLMQSPSGDIAKDAQRMEKVVKGAVKKIFSKYPTRK